MKKILLMSAALALLALPSGVFAADGTATPGKALKMVLLPKFSGNAVFDLAHNGALEAAKELQNPTDLQFLAPPASNPTGQIDIITNATTQGVNAIMISDNIGDQLAPAVKAAHDKGIKIVTWDSQIPSGANEDVFVAQVDFTETGKVMADMALQILPNGGKFAILSASPDASNQNAWIKAFHDLLKTDTKYAKLQEVELVYGNDESEKSYNEALALVDKHSDLQLIIAPTTIGIVAASKAMQDEKLCDKVKVSGLGLPSEMLAYTKNGCAPNFALWDFTNLGYLSYYVAYELAAGDLKAEDGAKFKAGRMGDYTIKKDPTRANGLRVLMGPFSIYDKSNIEAATK